MNFRDRARRAQIANPQGKRGIELSGIKQLEESPLGIDARNNRFDSDFLAIRKNDPRNPAIFRTDVLNFSVGTNLHAGLASGVRKRTSEGAKPAAWKCSRANGVGVGSRAKKQHGRRARRPGTKRGPKNPARGNHSAQQIRFEKFRNEIRDGHRAPTQQIENSLLAEAANAAASLEQIPKILGRRRIDGRRRHRDHFTKHTEKMIERFGELRVLRGVFLRVPRNFGRGLGVVVIENQRFAFGRGSKDARIGPKNFAIEFGKFKIARDVRSKRAESMGKSRDVKARMELFRDRPATDHLAAFEHQRLEAALRQIESGDESVVAAADNGYALSDGHV